VYAETPAVSELCLLQKVNAKNINERRKRKLRDEKNGTRIHEGSLLVSIVCSTGSFWTYGTYGTCEFGAWNGRVMEWWKIIATWRVF